MNSIEAVLQQRLDQGQPDRRQQAVRDQRRHQQGPQTRHQPCTQQPSNSISNIHLSDYRISPIGDFSCLDYVTTAPCVNSMPT